MFDKLCNNLNLCMANARINASELARKTGVPASTIKKIRNGDNPNPTLTTLIPIAQNFSLTLSQLVGDETMPIMEPTPATTPSIPATYLPMLTWEEAVNWPCQPSAFSEIISTDNQACFALTITEDHWEGFEKNAITIIHTELPLAHRHFVLVHKSGQYRPVVRQWLEDDGKHYLKPLIQGMEVCAFTKEYRVIGTVIEVRRHLITPNHLANNKK